MSRHPLVGASKRRESVAVVLGAVFLTLGLYWPTVASFPGTWSQYGMSHGWVVAGLVAWLAWRDREELLRGAGGTPLMMIPLVGLSVFWFAATVAHIQLFHQVTFVVLVVCWGLAVFGGPALRTLAVAGATFLLALPLWGPVAPLLRPLTTLASGGAAKLLGIPAEIEGDLVHIPSGSFLIEDGCAGLNTFLAGLVIGVFYAHVLVKGWRTKLAVVGLAAAVSIVGNWVRVAALIVIGHVTEMQSGLMERHIGFGWVVFTLGLLPFFLLARLVEKRSERKSGVPDDAREAGPGQPDSEARLASGGASSREEGLLGRRQAIGLMKRAGGATAVAAFGPLVFYVMGALPAAETRELPLTDLARAEGWHAEEFGEERSFHWQPSYPGAQKHESLEFTDGSTSVYGDRFVYWKQRQGSKLIGYPNELASRENLLDERIVGPVDPEARLWVRQAVVRSSDEFVLVWYWYRVGGVDTFSPVHAKVLEVPAFLGRHRAAELVALSAVCGPEDCSQALQALASFMGSRVSAPNRDLAPQDSSPDRLLAPDEQFEPGGQ